MPISLRCVAAAAWATALAALGPPAGIAAANDSFPIQLAADGMVTGGAADAGDSDPLSTLPAQGEISPSATVPGNSSDTTYDLSEAALAFHFALVAAPDFAHAISETSSSSASLSFIPHAQIAYELTHDYVPGGIVPNLDNAQLEIELTDTTAPLLSYHFLANDFQPPLESGPALGVLLAEHVYQLTYQTHAKADLSGSHHVTDMGSVTLQVAPEPEAPAPAAIAGLALLTARSRRRTGRRRRGEANGNVI